jgi:hypothetical protein
MVPAINVVGDKRDISLATSDFPAYMIAMSDIAGKLSFSQRTGLVAVPPQLQVGEVSSELRRLIDYYIGLEIEKVQRVGDAGLYFYGKWERVSKDFHVLLRKSAASSYANDPNRLRQFVARLCSEASIGPLFDCVEFFASHPICSSDLKTDLAGAFVSARAAYRIIDGQIIPIGTAEQGAAFLGAIASAEAYGADAARAHLIAAGAALRASDWPGSVRESINAVESMARTLEPSVSTLGPALDALEKRGHLHGALKRAFSALYGYTSDEKGIRHALVLEDKAQVDETDALFMLGSCASFVSYLIARAR